MKNLLLYKFVLSKPATKGVIFEDNRNLKSRIVQITKSFCWACTPLNVGAIRCGDAPDFVQVTVLIDCRKPIYNLWSVFCRLIGPIYHYSLI
ncbi:hypothetical protein D3C73_1213630 [compost metagenome]